MIMIIVNEKICLRHAKYNGGFQKRRNKEGKYNHLK